MERVIDHCRRIGTAKIGIQLAHAGRKASSQRPWEGGGPLKAGQDPWPTIAPSALPFGAGWHTPRAMTEDDIARVRDGLRRGGEARGAHRLRRRSSCTSRTAICCTVPVADLQQAHRPLRRLAREPHALPARDRAGGARRACRADAARRAHHRQRLARRRHHAGRRGGAVAKALKAAGLDYRRRLLGRRHRRHPQSDRPGYNVPIAERVRRETGIATRTVGLIVTPKQAEAIVAEGKADMVAMARAMLDDPHWGWHAAPALGAEVARAPQYLRVGPKLWAPAAAKSKG